MEDHVSLRAIQAALAVAYLMLVGLALAQTRSLATASVALAVMAIAYATSRTLPDIAVPRAQIGRLCAVAFAVIVIGAAAEAWGGSQFAQWCAIVMAYCAGNRLRAAGLGPAVK